MNNFLELISKNFGNLIHRFGLSVISVDEDDILLVSKKGFALRVFRDFDFVRINYIRRTDGGDFFSYPITGTAVERRFTAEDYSLYGEPLGLVDTIDALLRVDASGLEKRCMDILDGDVAWLQQLQRKDREAWSGNIVSLDVRQILSQKGV